MIVGFIKRIWRQLKSAAAYAVMGSTMHEYDYAEVWELLEFKLRRLEDRLKNGPAVQGPQTLKSIRIAIKLLQKLRDDDYMYYYLKAVPEESDKVAIALKSPEYLEFVTKEIKKDTESKKRDIRLLFDIMNNHITDWWT